MFFQKIYIYKKIHISAVLTGLMSVYGRYAILTPLTFQFRQKKKKKTIFQVHLFGSFLIGRLLKATKGLLPPWCLWFRHGRFFGFLNDHFVQADYKLQGSKAILVVPTQKRNITAKIQNVNEPCCRILRRRLVCVVTTISIRFTLSMLGFTVMLHDCSLSSHDIHKTGLGPFKRRIVFFFYFHEPKLHSNNLEVKAD